MSLFSLLPLPKRHSQLTLREILEQHYIPAVSLGKPTIHQYRSDLRRWDRIVGSHPVGRIREAHFRQFRRQCIDNGFSIDTMRNSQWLVRSLLIFAHDRGWIRSLPVW